MHFRSFAIRSRIIAVLVAGEALALSSGCTKRLCASGSRGNRHEDRCVEKVVDRDPSDAAGSGDEGDTHTDEPSIGTDGPDVSDANLHPTDDAGDPLEATVDAGAKAEAGPMEVALPEAGTEAGASETGSETAPLETWELVPGSAREVAVGANGDVWIIGTSEERFGYSVHKRIDDRWVRVQSDGAQRVAVDPAGVPWIVTNKGSTLRRGSNAVSDAAWSQMPGCAIDIGIGATGAIWSVQCDGLIYKWDGAAWVNSGTAAFSALNVAVAPDGTPWVLDRGERVFRRTSPLVALGRWEYLHGTGARDLAVAPDGSISIVSDVAENGGFIVKLLNRHGAWVPVDGSAGAQSLAASADALWITDATLRILRLVRAHER